MDASLSVFLLVAALFTLQIISVLRCVMIETCSLHGSLHKYTTRKMQPCSSSVKLKKTLKCLGWSTSFGVRRRLYFWRVFITHLPQKISAQTRVSKLYRAGPDEHLCLWRLVRSRSPSPLLPRRSRTSSPVRSESPTRAQLTNSSRHARLVSRFSDLYATERLEGQSLLRRYIDDLETVQRIIFISAVVWIP